MGRSLYNWLDRGGISRRGVALVLSGAALAAALAAAGGLWYYQQRAQRQQEAERERAAAALEGRRAGIRAFYEGALAGTDPEGFLALYREILGSRRALELSGFKESGFTCAAAGCDFSYRLGEGAVFSVQEKWFSGRAYAPSFSGSTADYTGLMPQMKSPQLEAYRRGAALAVPSCKQMLGYLYGYNSVAGAQGGFSVTGLPESPVSADEEALADIPESRGLLAGKWQAVLDDSYLAAEVFWRGQPYPGAFIIQSVSGKDGRTEVSGTFMCGR